MRKAGLLRKLTSTAHEFRCAHWASILYAFVWCFGSWTLFCNIAVSAKLGLRSLTFFAPIPLAAGIYCALQAIRRSPPAEAEILPSSDAVRKPPDAVRLRASHWPWLALACLIVSLRRIVPSSYIPFWIICVLFLAAWSVFGKSHLRIDYSFGARYHKSATRLLVALGVLCAGLTFVAHRPDPDDSFFVGVISDSVAHPDSPLLQRDPLYGGHRFPLNIPTYVVDSIELFTSVLARTFGGMGSMPPALFWAHTVVPVFFAMLMPFAWAFFLRSVARGWMEATIVTLVLLILLGETNYSLGNFAFVRLFQGKAVLASLGIPLIFGFAWQFHKTGRAWDWLTLWAAGVAALGLSSSGLFLIPMALGIAAAASWRPKATWRSLLVFIPALYPIAWGLGLRHSFSVVLTIFDVHRTIAGVVEDVFGRHGQYLIFFGLLAAPLFGESERRRRMLSYAALLYFLGPLNPFLFPFFSKLTTGESVWRTLWSLPVAGITGIAAAGIFFEALSRRQLRSPDRTCKIEPLAYIIPAFAVLSIAAVLFSPSSTLRSWNGVTFSLSPYKIPPGAWSVATAASAAAPPSTSVLAPDLVAEWIPILMHRPELVSVRPNYDGQMASRMMPWDAATRRDLRELVSGMPFSAKHVHELLQALPHYRVSVIVVRNSTSKQLSRAIAAHGYSISRTFDRYVLWNRTRRSQH